MSERHVKQMIAPLGLTLLLAGVPGLQAAEPRDPTRPPRLQMQTAAPAAEQALRLESVLVSPARRLAVINGQLLAEGDRVQAGQGSPSAQVIEIQREGVLVDRGGNRQRLRLPSLPDVRRDQAKQ